MSKDESERDVAQRRIGELLDEFRRIQEECRSAEVRALAHDPENMTDEEVEAATTENLRVALALAAIRAELDEIWAEMPRIMKEHQGPPMMLTQERMAEFTEVTNAIDVIHKSAAEGTLVRSPETIAQHDALMKRMRAILQEAEERAKRSS